MLQIDYCTFKGQITKMFHLLLQNTEAHRPVQYLNNEFTLQKCPQLFICYYASSATSTYSHLCSARAFVGVFVPQILSNENISKSSSSSSSPEYTDSWEIPCCTTFTNDCATQPLVQVLLQQLQAPVLCLTRCPYPLQFQSRHHRSPSLNVQVIVFISQPWDCQVRPP